MRTTAVVIGAGQESGFIALHGLIQEREAQRQNDDDQKENRNEF